MFIPHQALGSKAGERRGKRIAQNDGDSDWEFRIRWLLGDSATKAESLRHSKLPSLHRPIHLKGVSTPHMIIGAQYGILPDTESASAEVMYSIDAHIWPPHGD